MSDPPKKRLRLILTLDAHDLSDLNHALRVIGNDLEHEGREQYEGVSSAGGHMTLTQRSDLTEADYLEALDEWAMERRRKRENA